MVVLDRPRLRLRLLERDSPRPTNEWTAQRFQVSGVQGDSENLCASRGASVSQMVASVAPHERAKNEWTAQRFPHHLSIAPIYNTTVPAKAPARRPPALTPPRPPCGGVYRGRGFREWRLE